MKPRMRSSKLNAGNTQPLPPQLEKAWRLAMLRVLFAGFTEAEVARGLKDGLFPDRSYFMPRRIGGGNDRGRRKVDTRALRDAEAAFDILLAVLRCERLWKRAYYTEAAGVLAGIGLRAAKLQMDESVLGEKREGAKAGAESKRQARDRLLDEIARKVQADKARLPVKEIWRRWGAPVTYQTFVRIWGKRKN
jgi:hypothetical protein